MHDPRIRDIPSIKQLLDDSAALELVGRAFPVAKPLLKLLGIKVNQMETALSEVSDLAHRARELAAIPDRFNQYFASRGWISYDSMNVELAQAAVAKAEAGDIDGAEENLVAHYTPSRIEQHLRLMNGVRAFRPRLALAHKALTDYAEGRYYACVPVTLALLDGLVNELGPRGFFAEGVNLEAWDSIAAHSSGLQELSKILGAGRYQTQSRSYQGSLSSRHPSRSGSQLRQPTRGSQSVGRTLCGARLGIEGRAWNSNRATTGAEAELAQPNSPDPKQC